MSWYQRVRLHPPRRYARGGVVYGSKPIPTQQPGCVFPKVHITADPATLIAALKAAHAAM